MSNKTSSPSQGMQGRSSSTSGGPEFVTFRESDFSGGIDQQSSENRIPDGFLADATNADPLSTGQMRKRAGFQGFAGDLPLRVESLTYTTDATNNIQLTFDSSVVLPPGQQSPLIVMGRTSAIGNPSSLGDFGTSSDSIHYYSAYRPNLTRAFGVGTTTLNITQEEHGFTNPELFVSLALAPSSSSLDNSQIIPQSVEINKSTLNIAITLVNSTGSDVSIYIFIADKSAVAGDTYVSTLAVGTGTITKSFPAATHNLSTFHITTRCFEDTGTLLREIMPLSTVLNSTTGNVDVTLVNSTGSSINVAFVLTVVPTENDTTTTVNAGATKVVTFDASEGTSTPFVTVFEEVGSTLTQILPNLVEYDSTTELVSVTIQNNQASSASFRLYWEFIQPATNTLTISGTVIGAGFTDTQPQLTVWGFLHSEIYGPGKAARDGWVTHIDSYRAAGEERLVSGLGGNFFAARGANEGVNFATYLMPTYYPALNGRMNANSVVGQAFWETGETVNRDRGYISADDASEGYLQISEITYNSGTGWVDYTLTGTNIVANGTLSTIISSTSNLEDWFTASQCGHAIHEGIFKIKGVNLVSSTELVISVENTSDDPKLFHSDETDSGGLGGIFTDRLVLSGTSYFQEGDLLTSEEFSDADILTVTSSSGSTVVVNGLIEEFTLPVGLRIVGSRVSSVIPMRTLDGTTAVTNLVRGDMLSYTGIGRQLRIKSINTWSDLTGQSVTGDGETATVTLGSGDNTSLFIGKKLLLQASTSYNGVVEVTALVGTTQFQFASTADTTETVTIVGKTVEVDEELSWADNANSVNSFQVVSRWIPYELPQDSFNQTPKTKSRHFEADPFSDMNITRSTMVQNNLYLNDYSNPAMKIDGTNIYRAGLPRWQSQLFAAVDTGATGKIVMSNPTVAVVGESGNQFKVAAGDEVKFLVGDIIRHDNDGEDYTVTDTSVSTFITVDRAISGTGGNITRTSTFKYYARVNAIDSNRNIIASAVTGSGDFAVRLAEDAAITVKAVGMPSMDLYDYDTLEVQWFRTKSDGEVFYLLTTLAQSFNHADGYLLYTDTASDSDLFELDNVTQALVGANRLGTGWEQPLRAKYTTSAGNRLVLGNIQDWPLIDLRFVKNSGILTQSTFTTAANRKYIFRRDDSDTSSNTTNMVDRFTTEFVPTSSAVTIDPTTDIANNSNTSFTVTEAGHGLLVGDWVYLYHSAVADGKSLQYAGWFQIASRDANTFTISHTQPTGYVPGADDVDRYITATAQEDIPVLIGTDGNRATLSGNRGTTLPYEFIAASRMADAINAAMRKTNTAITGQELFVPWLTAGAGNDFELGQVVLRQPLNQEVTPSIVLPALSGAFDVYVNDIRRIGASSSSAVTKIFPSRIVMSYVNFPEIFDRPTTADEFSSDSVIDINSSDGQEITGIIPFFGEAAFGAAQNSSVLVAFKTNSIYLVDLTAKALNNGSPIIQKVDSFGKGCTAPYSIAATRNGIMFANESGIYRLNRAMQVEYLGKRYERKWQGVINTGELDILTGTHDSFTHSYKVSYPLQDETQNSMVAVYNHTREMEGILGSWTTYDNHSATGWANLGNDSFFGNVNGRVMIIRRLGEDSDYRDDSSAVEMSWTTRAMDMGDSGRRKLFSRIVTHYRNVDGVVSGTTLGVSMNTNGVFQETDTFTLRSPSEVDNLSDSGTQTIFPVISVAEEKTGVYIQCRYENSTIDEPVEITGIDFRVAPMAIYGISEAKQLR